MCHICEKDLLVCKETGEIFKVRDHCHFTGKYRGAAHNQCNLNCRKPLILPVVFHHLQGYDSHLFIKQLAKVKGELSCIQLKKSIFHFLKKLKLLNTISERMGQHYQPNSKFVLLILSSFFKHHLLILFQIFNQQISKILILISKKTHHFYPGRVVIHMIMFHRLIFSKKPKDLFYSKLYDENISEENYQHVIKVWDSFNCKTIQYYHDIYLKSDVLLLADVFENFRKTCLKHYKLDPCHYYTAPGLAWDACLKETKQNLELLKDYDVLMMFERGIRGGITHISKRYAEANNKYMKNYNPDKPSSYIQYLDANNLYGWAMSQKLPTHGFKWIDYDKTKILDLLKKKRDTNKGYVFEVDLEYPKKLWKSQNDYPLAPEKIKVDNVEKLICSFKPKNNYVLHYRNLKQYLKQGMVLKKVHRGIKFYQSKWMEPYIRKNTDLRKPATSSFEKNFITLMNNSVFGKTIENIRKRQNVILIDNKDMAYKLSSKPNFNHSTIFDENLIACHMKKTEVYFNKPIYVGQAILDLSKTLMFDFHYNYIKEKFGDRAELLFKDTDSLMYLIQTEDFYQDINKDIKRKFDTSDYPEKHPSGIKTGINKKVIGKFKDEAAGKQITHSVGLRPKLYSFKVQDSSETRKAKGVKKNVIKNTLSFEDYKKCLFSEKEIMKDMNIIRSKNHDIYSMTMIKIALSANDDKGLISQDKINTKALT